MSRTLLAAALLSLTACQGPVAPADATYDADLEEIGRSTALGERTTFEAPAGVWDFGRNVGLSGDTVIVTERANGTACANRLRAYTRGATGGYTETTSECAVPHGSFGEVLATSPDAELWTGAEAFWPQSTGLVADGVLGTHDASADPRLGASAALLSFSRVVIGAPGHGPSGAAVVLDNDGGSWDQVAVLSHPGIAANGGLGTTVMGDGKLVVLGDALGRSVVFEQGAGDAWFAIDAPAPRILAVHGDTVLAEPATGSDLWFWTRANGAWEPVGLLHDAKGSSSTWAFDEVAAFGAMAGGTSGTGWVDRWTRSDGEIDASVRVTGQHTALHLALDGGWLAVAESMSVGTSGNGRVHVFDWTATRGALLTALSCPNGEDALEPNEDATAASTYADGTYTLSAGSREDWFRLTVGAGEAVTLTASFVQADGDIDLYLKDAAGNTLDSALSANPTETVSWTNTGAAPVEVFARAHLYSTIAGCTSYSLQATFDAPEPTPTCPIEDAHEPNDSVDLPAVVFPSAVQVVTSASPNDFWLVSDAIPSGIFNGETVRVDLTFQHAEGDLDLKLVAPDGTVLASGMSITDNEQVTWTNTANDPMEARVQVQWFSPPTDGVCVPYTLAIELVDPPAAPAE